MSGHIRTRVLGLIGVLLAVACVCAPLAAYAETPQDWNTNLTLDGFKPIDSGPVYWFNTMNLPVQFDASATVKFDDTNPQLVKIGGFAYSLDRTPFSLITSPGAPGAPLYSAFAPGSASTSPIASDTVNFPGWVLRQAAPYWVPGMNDPAEGVWYLHAESIAYDGPGSYTAPSGVPTLAVIGIDITPPNKPINMYVASPVAAGNVTSSTIADIVWDNPRHFGNDYDALSGDAAWIIQLDGTTIRQVPNIGAWDKNSFTVESLHPGKNIVGVATVDYAGNASQFTTMAVYSDPETPTVTFTSPVGDYLNSSTNFAVNVDDGYTQNVVFKFDGVTTATVLAAPYEFQPDLAGVSAGPHVVTATATDYFGRTSTATKNVVYLQPSIGGYQFDSSGALDQTMSVAWNSSSPDASGQLWGNTLNQTLTFSNVPDHAGLLYAVDKTPGTIVDISQPSKYFKTLQFGTSIVQPLDLPGVIAYPPTGGWPALGSGETTTAEGKWYVHFIAWDNNAHAGTHTQVATLAIDVNPPTAVSVVHASPTTNPADAVPWADTSRMTVSFPKDAADALSGVRMYRVYIDGAAYASAFATDLAAPDFTVEDLTPGQHKIDVTAVDYAGNEGPKTTTYFGSDTDSPRVDLTSPTNHIIDWATVVSADASDNAGSPTVVFKLDATTLSTITVAPYSFTPSIMSLAPGAHVLSATAIDNLGRSVTTTTAVTVVQPALPTVAIAAPTDGIIDYRTTLGAAPTADGANPSVAFKLDATTLGTVTAPPYQLVPDFSTLPTGTHTLSVVATDQWGRSATATELVNVLVPTGLRVGSSALEATITGVSSTNPNKQDDPVVWWRNGWGNSLRPKFDITPPSTDPLVDGFMAGIIYNVDKSATSTIDITHPENYDLSTNPRGTNLDLTVDMLGVIAAPPAGGWPPFGPGETSVAEGVWYMHFRPYTTRGYTSDREWISRIGIDLTAPRAVAGLTATPTSGPSAWNPNTRLKLEWTPGTYDDLSGVAYYQLFIDGVPIAGDQGRVWETAGKIPSEFTIENVPAGKHSYGVAAVDRAENQGPIQAVDFYSDPDVPKITITSPLNGFLNKQSVVSANATDAAGDPTVNFAFDGSNVATIAAPPYSFKPDLSALVPGVHLLAATVTDHFGRTVTTTMSVTSVSATSSVVGGFQPSDTGALDGPFIVSSKTNPIPPGDPDSDWRNTWGNSGHPTFTFSPPSLDASTDGVVQGLLYSLDKSPTSTIDVTHPDQYFRTARGNSTNMDTSVDLLGTLLYPPAGGWPALGPGENSHAEGQWYLHYTFFTSNGYAGGAAQTVPFKVDMTPPRSVTNLQSSPTTNPADGGSWTSATRAHVTWTPNVYDDLSGVAYYRVYIDGRPMDQDASQGRIWEQADKTPSSFTIENMPEGRHAIGVTAVDRAGNESTPSVTYFTSDVTPPTVAITSPTNHVIDYSTTIKATATDAAGSPTVVFALDGTTLATITAPPYSLLPDLLTMPTGLHTLSATAIDTLGRSATATTSVVVSAAPAPEVSFTSPVGSPPHLIHGAPVAVECSTSTVVSTVTVTLNDATILSTSTAPFTVIPDLTSLPDGSYVLTATVTDRFGRTAVATESAAWKRPLPNISFTSPTGSALSSGVPVAVTAASSIGDPAVTISMDSTALASFDAGGEQTHQFRGPGNKVVGPFHLPGGTTSLSWINQQTDFMGNNIYFGKFDIKLLDSQGDIVANPVTQVGELSTGASTLQIDGAAPSAGDYYLMITNDTTFAWTVRLAVTGVAPYSVVPDLSQVPAGTYLLTAVATNAYGSTTTTKSVTVNPVDYETNITVPAITSPDKTVPPSGRHWLNTLNPVVGFGVTANPGAPPVTFQGYDYLMSRDVPPAGTFPSSIYSAFTPFAGPLTANTLDVEGWSSRPATSYAEPGMHDPGEGRWYLSARPLPSEVSGYGYANTVPLDFDFTPPSEVGTVSVSSSETAQGLVPGTIASFVWPAANGASDYDDLSGTWGWSVKLNGSEVAKYPVVSLHTTPTVTIENLAQGENVVEIAAVDWAGNVGPYRAVTVYSKPIAPVVSITSPADSSIMPSEPITADVGTATLDPHVTIDFAGSTLLSTSTAPFAVVPDVMSLPSGSYVITATVVDRFGRSAVETKSVTWTQPPLPAVSILTPSDNVIDYLTTLRAHVAAAGSTPTVVFGLDATTLATVTAPPYSFRPDFSTLPTGPHTLKMTVIDQWGRSAIATKLVDVITPTGLRIDESGALEATISGVSSTNPNNPMDQTVWYREGWGNTLRPQFTVTPPSTDPLVSGYVAGMIYQVDKSATSTIDITHPENYDRSTNPQGTNLDTTVDMLGVIAAPPSGGWPPLGPGENSTAEGLWYFHFRPYTTLGYTSNREWYVRIGIDLTAPRAVAGLTATPTSGPSSWNPNTRVKLSWTPGAYDDLSGVAYYQAFIDGVAIDSDQGRIWDAPGKTPSEFTIENALAGKHAYGIAAVDRAGNVGPVQSVDFYSDPDVPKITITSPVNGFLNKQSIISATATDQAGDPTVKFALDGSNVATIASPPYSFKPDLAAIVPGVHTLAATVTDHYGRTVTTTMSVTSVSATSSVVGGFQPSDTGALDGPFVASSKTNPIPPGDPDSEWRNTWGNSFHPIFTVAPPSTDASLDGSVQGMLYSLDKSPTSTIDISHPDQYFRTSRGGSTNMDASLDLLGTLMFPPAGGWPALGPGENSHAEGQWYLHYTYFTSNGFAGGITQSVPFKVDVTAPRSVRNLQSSPTTNPADGGTWTSATRAHISWTPDVYDDLSGVAFYRVYLDGEPLDKESGQGRVWEQADKTPSSYTIENMPEGRHQIAVTAVDRAGNESTPSITYFTSDVTPPTVSITAPVNGSYINASSVVSAIASDAAGFPSVTFAFDGVATATVAAPPYQFTPNLAGVPTGVHTITATATDHLGRIATATVTVSTLASTPTGYQPTDDHALEGTVTGTSSTNPNDPSDVVGMWRQGWGNSMHPQFHLSMPEIPATDGKISGLLYAVDKNPLTQVDIAHPERYYHSADPKGTELDETIDLQGVINYPPTGGWPALGPGETSVAEGQWYVHFVMITDKGYAGTITRVINFGVDLNAPSAPGNLQASPTTNPADAAPWVDSSRAHVTWSLTATDALSGVAYYQLYLDGSPIAGPAGQFWDVSGKTPPSLTIENMPAGRHEISISAVDRAGNEGPKAKTFFGSDVDSPTVAITSPTNNIIDWATVVSADATDKAGDPTVVFKLDATTLATVTAPPYTYSPDVMALPAGPHVLSATATDKLGRSVTTTTAVTVVRPSLPTISISSPTDGLIDYRTKVSANATATGGNPTVVFKLDATTLATVTAPPYTFSPDISTLPSGAHVLSASATDRWGRTVTTTEAVAVIAPTGLRISDSGSLDATITGFSSTNPNNPADSTAWYRNGWGNTLRPQFTVSPPSTDPLVDGYVSGMIYQVDKTATTTIDITHPELYSRSSNPNGTNMDTTVDMLGVEAYPPSGGWPPLGPGETSLSEGMWYFHFVPFTTKGYASSFTRYIKIGIDLTAPRAVNGLLAAPSTSSTSWAGTSRLNLAWTPGTYDDLSGVAYYQIFIDGVPLDATQGRIWDVPGKTPSTFTIENAPAGKHTYGVAAVDRAGNQGAMATVDYYSDPDVPKINFTSPLNGFLNSQSVISVNATDAAGAPLVKLAIDGSNVATIAAPPYSYKPDISTLVPGVHLLAATATDHFGRTVLTTMSVTSVSTTSSVVGGFEPSDSGALDGPFPVSSSTNPIPPSDTDSSWRDTWGNTLHPMFAMSPPSLDASAEGLIQGMLYTVDKSPTTSIDITHPDWYYRASRGTGTNLDTSLDLLGTLAFPPAGGWPALGPGEASHAEGQWYVHYTFFTSKGYAGGITQSVPFKVDVTPPRSVNNLTSSPTTNPADGGSWTTASRAHIAWTPGVYDDLSGVAYYRVYIDDVAIDKADPTQGRVWEQADKTPSSYTVENMLEGRHKISVTVVDRTGNESAPSVTYFTSDVTPPHVSFTSPTNGIVNYKTTISINATDAAGDPSVVLSLDASTLATFAAPPYTYKPDVAALPAGAHVLSATATDHLGRTVTTTMAVTVIGPQPGFTPSDSGAMDVGMLALSSTNPDDESDSSSWWRQGWGNSLQPIFSIQPPTVSSSVDGFVVGSLYAVDKSSDTTIDITHPELYDRASRGTGTNMDASFDMLGIAAAPPVGGWPAPGPGEHSVLEGRWYYHLIPFTSKGFAGVRTHMWGFGIDLTPPRAVNNLTVAPVSGPAAYVTTHRATLTWTPGVYDDLSGVAYYRIYLDGVALDSDPTQGRVFDLGGKAPSTFTVENMPGGHHTLSVACVDRATNEGPKSTVDFYSDPDTPTVSFVSPTDGIVNYKTTISAVASDAAGSLPMTMSIGASTIATFAGPPYDFKPADVTSLPAGAQVLSATVRDHFGRSVTTTLAVTVVHPTTGFEADPGLDQTVNVSSLTNPSDPLDSDSWWRFGWSNTNYPQFSMSPPDKYLPKAEGLILGMIYTVDKSADTTIDITKPQSYYRNTFGGDSNGGGPFGTNMSQLLDMVGLLNKPPVGGWPWTPGATSPLEGQWYYHYTYYTSFGTAGPYTHIVPFGVDVTPPRAVANLQASPSMNPADGGVWTDANRVHLTWTPGKYDDLSGVGYYRIFIDGQPLDADPNQGRVYDLPGHTPYDFTLETVPPGQHQISVACVDRATNQGPLATTTYFSDPDTPTISFTSPASGFLNSKTIVSVDASDKAGNPTVVFRFDGVATATVLAPPYSFRPKLAGISAGNHVITATATDHMGHTATATKNVSTIAATLSGFEPDDTGALDVPASGFSATHPNAGDATWRRSWGNSVNPQFTINVPSVSATDSGNVIGMLYTLDKTPTTQIDISHPERYFRSGHGAGTDLNETVDLMSIVSHPPAGGWPPPALNEVSAVEGQWYMHFVMFTDQGYAGTVTHAITIGMDVTPPRAVQDLHASPTTNPADGGTWTDASRAHLSWMPQTYDDLSGVAYYQVYMDGNPVDPMDGGRVWEVEGKTPASFTIENVPPGLHRLGVAAVDRATNVGPVTTVNYMSDPDTPTITLLSPLNHKLSGRTVVSVDASDKAGNPTVVFRIDGVATATVTAPPYSIIPNTTGLSSGIHTITVSATDHLGRTASVTTTATKASVGAGFIPSESDVLNGPINGSSTTNPNDPSDPTVWWRSGWGNTMTPQFEISTPSDVASEGYVVGMLYAVDRSPTTTVDISRPDLYHRTSRGSGTNMDTTVDLQGVLDFPPAGGWPTPSPGEVLPGEGIWYMHFAPFTSDGYAAATTHYIKIGVDMTKPRAVSNLIVSPSLRPGDANQWVESSRAIVTWNQGVYDDLSGVAYYQVYVDGKAVDDSLQGHVFEIEGKTPTSYTIENMPAGMHRVSVAVVDRAGNVGPLASGYFYSDPDIPTIQFGSFSRTVGVKPNFTVVVNDVGGIRSVRYTLDGQQLGTITDSPYDIHADLSGFSSGQHTLTAIATDQYGHVAQVSTTITLDKTPLTLSAYSRTPSIFYPILRDGYYDNSTISFTLNKSASASLAIRNSAGKIVRTLTKNAVKGKNTLTWDGKWTSDGKAHTGTFTYQLTVTDAIGNKVTSGKLSTTIRNYQLVKMAGNVVKVIPR